MTNDVVYVGATKNLNARIQTHTSKKSKNTLIGKWIQDLKSQYFLPKIEILEICDGDDLYINEGFWISQLTAWGFNLFNYNKTNKIKNKYLITAKKSGAVSQREIRIRTSKAWSLDDMQIGNTFKINDDFKSRRTLTASFKNYCRKFKFNVIRYLSYEKSETGFTATVIDTKPIKTILRVSKKGRTYRAIPIVKKVYPPKRIRPKRKIYFFENVKIGDSINIDFKKWESFKNSLFQFNALHKTNIRYRYKPSDNCDYVIVTYVDKVDKTKNIPIPTHLVRSQNRLK